MKGLFLSIWRHIQSSVQDHMNGYGTLAGGGFNTYKGALLRGTQVSIYCLFVCTQSNISSLVRF